MLSHLSDDERLRRNLKAAKRRQYKKTPEGHSPQFAPGVAASKPEARDKGNPSHETIQHEKE